MAQIKAGQVTVVTAGTAVSFPARSGNIFSLVAHPSNAGTIWIGNDGVDDVTSDNGYPLTPGGAPLVLAVINLDQLRIDASTSGDKVCWLVLEE